MFKILVLVRWSRQVPGSQWTVSLAHLVSSRTVKNLVCRKKEQEGHCLRNDIKVALRLLHTDPHMSTRICSHTQTHIHVCTHKLIIMPVSLLKRKSSIQSWKAASPEAVGCTAMGPCSENVVMRQPLYKHHRMRSHKSIKRR